MKKIRVFMPLLLVIVCQVAVYGAAKDTGPALERGHDGVFYIRTADELAALPDGLGNLYVLDADIQLTPGWIPIGSNTDGSTFAFKGSLDGRGHTIRGLRIDVAGSETAGLFSKLEGANISNIVLADAYMQIDGNKTGNELAAGLLAGEVVGGTIHNVTVVDGVITVHGHSQENWKIGGLVGFARDTSFYNCGTKGSVVAGKSIAGGFAGRLEGVGGVLECYSHTDVTGGIVGGFAGQISGNPVPANANHTLEVVGCRATGDVVINVTDTIRLADVIGVADVISLAGGFVGEGEYVFIADSASYGEVRGGSGAGGFVGRLSNLSRVMYSYAKGDVFSKGFAGGFVGELVNTACVEFSYAAGSAIVGDDGTVGLEATAAGGFAGIISSYGAPNTITHCLSFAPWVVGDGYVHRFAGRMDHDGVNGCYSFLGSMVVRSGGLTHVLPSAYGPDGADMSRAQVDDVTKRLGWKWSVNQEDN